MKDYSMTIERTIKVITTIIIEANDENDAIARFHHQLESNQCSAIEDEILWREALYYQSEKAGPYSGDYEVIDVNPADF